MSDRHFAEAEVLPELPARLPSGRGEPFPEGLIGATIDRIGTLPDSCGVEGGGLVIDYRNGPSVGRVVFGFNELGMWLEYQYERAAT